MKPTRPVGARALVRRRGSWSAAALLLLACLGLSSPASAASSESLSSSVATANGSWAVLPMGDLTQPDNTFWQVLRSSPGSSRWSVVTPRGVADNGGIVAGVAGEDIVVGILPSQLLQFSPLASSTDGGDSWNPAPFPGALVSRPDAVAVGASGYLAVTGSWVLRASSSASTWSRLISRHALARLDPRCDATLLEGVAFGPDLSPLVATTCRAAGAVGLFRLSGGTWSSVGTALRGAWRRASTSVLRVLSSATGSSALVLASSAGRNALFALSSSAGGHWTSSSALRLAPGQYVSASAAASDRSFAVLVKGDGKSSVETVGPARPWQTLPTQPAHTIALASLVPVTATFAAGSYVTFAVTGARLRVFALAPGAGTWVPVQSTLVPLAYGSSG